jgi:hypothetical protein
VIGLSRGELQTCADVFGLQIQKIPKNFGFGYACSEEFQDVDHPNTHAANAGPSPTLPGIEGYPVEVTHTSKLPNF